MEILLSAKGISKTFQGKKVLDNINIEINNINATSGIYWLRDKNKSNIKPIKLVIE